MRHIPHPSRGDAERKLFLDAIASLSVCDAHSQVIAMALEQHPRTGKAVLWVAENGPVKSAVVGYIETLLGMVFRMARVYAVGRDEERSARVVGGYRVDLVRAVYCHGVLKHRHRFDRRWESLITTLRNTDLANGWKAGDCMGRIFNVVSALEMMRSMHEQIADGFIIPHSGWATFALVMDSMIADMDAIRGLYGSVKPHMIRLTPAPLHSCNGTC